MPAVLAHFTRVPVSAETARRLTEQAGVALEAAETAAVAALEAVGRLPPAPPERLQVGVDGAMVPLVHKAWAEVKTLAIGTVGTPEGRHGSVPHTSVLSYFSRLADADTFRRLAWVETQRRGVPAAADVCGVVDGADWCQHFLDWHCPAAVRILDWAHAAAYVSAAGQSVFGAKTPALTAWLDQQLTELQQGDPTVVLAALADLPAVTVDGPEGSHCPRDTALGYLIKRQAQITYAVFTAAGYPIGSGVVESANKLVVEARLKGSGMHWARPNVNPMLALRGAVCSDRWDAAWATLTHQRQQEAATARTRRAAARRPDPAPAVVAGRRPERTPVRRPRRGTMCDGRPTQAHPWRRDTIRHAADPAAAKS
ncbi:MAG TPA: ISKra4 family transposase [Longimicrobium sp.]